MCCRAILDGLCCLVATVKERGREGRGERICVCVKGREKEDGKKIRFHGEGKARAMNFTAQGRKLVFSAGIKLQGYLAQTPPPLDYSRALGVGLL